MKKKVTEKKRGMTLVEVLVILFVLALLEGAVILAFNSSFRMTKVSRGNISALDIANERIEELRNMPYDSLATLNGPIYPPGNLEDDYQVKRNSNTFNVHTLISYVDDPYDGNAAGTIPGKPKDLYPYDYKKLEVSVTNLTVPGIPVKISSNVAAKAAETPSNTGIINLCVVDAAGNPLQNATVKIQNTTKTPPVNIITTVGVDGCVMVPNLPPDKQNHYHLEATMSNYSQDQTYPRTAQNPNAVEPDVDVLEQQITNHTLVIDRVSQILLDVVDLNNQPKPGVTVHIEGSKLKYFNPATPKYVEDKVTDANGHIELNSMEFDEYHFSVNGWNVTTTSPYQPVYLSPGAALNTLVKIDNDNSQPRIKSCNPLSVKTGQIIYINVTGENLDNNLSVKLVSGASVINGSEVTVNGGKNLEFKIDLTAAPVGNWDIVITNPDGKRVTQLDGIIITN